MEKFRVHTDAYFLFVNKISLNFGFTNFLALGKEEGWGAL